MSTSAQDPYAIAAQRCAERFGEAPSAVVILGSGMGVLEQQLTGAERCGYTELGLPNTAVKGHAGALIVGNLGEARIALLSGRIHSYEAPELEHVVRGVRAMAAWGVPNLVMTSAVGSLQPEMSPGDLVLITDHINLMGINPLVGPNIDALGPRFPDMSQAYDPELARQAEGAAQELELDLTSGVYVAVRGPSFETPAEVRMLGAAGGAVVGMSVVPETIAAVHAGMKVLTICVVSNAGTGLSDTPHDHDSVTATVARAADRLGALIQRVVSRW